MDRNFLLSSGECEILLAFERSSSLKNLAENLGKDISVVSRNLKSIGEKSDVLEKRDGRWHLSDKGRMLNEWTKEAIFSQRLAINKQKHIKIATTREFASRILLPKTRHLIGGEDVSVSIVSSDSGIESLILTGEADFGFDCGRPVDPMVAFKRVLKEPFVTVASPKFIERFKIKTYEDLENRDLLKFSRTEQVIWDLDVKSTRYYGTFTDLANLRQACVLGYGWAIMPLYTVKAELKEKKLRTISGLKVQDERYGVWWMRERKSVKPWVDRAVNWLSNQKLD